MICFNREEHEEMLWEGYAMLSKIARMHYRESEELLTSDTQQLNQQTTNQANEEQHDKHI
jgi:hypothetical protein